MAHRISRTDPSPSEGRILSRAALNARCALYLSTCCRSDLCSAYSARIQGWTYPGARYRHRSLCWTDAVLASRQVDVTGIELDPITAQIAKHLYPSATIIHKGF